MLAVTLGSGIDTTRGRSPRHGGLEGLFDVDPPEWASYASGLAMVHWLVGDHNQARYLLKLHSDNGFRRLGEDGEQLTTLLLFGRVASDSTKRTACLAYVRPPPAPCRSVGRRRDRGLLLGAGRDSSWVGSRSRWVGTPSRA